MTEEKEENANFVQVEQPTLEEIKNNPEYKEQARQVALNILNVVGGRWIDFKRFKKQIGGNEATEQNFYEMCQYLKEFDVAVIKVDRGNLKLKIDFDHETELELIEEELKAIDLKRKMVENRKQDLLELNKNKS